jgi:nucleotide-binding universal stress UspA family protein
MWRLAMNNGKPAGDQTDSWIKRIVVAVDSSPASLEGLKMAIDVARRAQAWVTVVHVRHSPATGALAPGFVQWGLVQQTVDTLEDHSRAATEQMLGGTGVDWEFRTMTGSPGEEIVKVAQRLGADMVVVGTSRHGSLRNLVLGSTSAYLASHSPTAVLIARPGSRAGLDGPASSGVPAQALADAGGVRG